MRAVFPWLIKLTISFFIFIFVILAIIPGCRFLPGGDDDSLAGEWATTSLKGKVVQPSGNPSIPATVRSADVSGAVGVSGAEVWIEELASDPRFHTTTDENGEFRFTNVPVGNYRIVSRYLDGASKIFKQRTTILPIKASSEGFEIGEIQLLSAVNIVTGQLRGPDGNFLPVGTTLSLWGEEFKIGENGRFVSPPLPNGVYDEEIKVKLPDGTTLSSFTASFISGVVPLFLDISLVAISDSVNNPPCVTLKAMSGAEIRSKVMPGNTISIIATGYDFDASDKGSLSLTWDCTLGTLSADKDGFHKSWTAPSFMGMATISAEIKDRSGAVGRAYLPILVGIDSPEQTESNRPTLVLSANAQTVIDSASFEVTLTFNEPVTGFSIEDIAVLNGVLSDFTAETSHKVFKVKVTPRVGGDVILSVAENVATDLYGNQNVASNLVTVNNYISPVKSSEKAITAFAFSGLSAIGLIDESSSTISVSVLYGTDVTNLAAIFSVSDKASVKVASTIQTSGNTTNNFSSPVIYVVTAEDGSTRNYTVTVTIGEPAQITSANVTITAPVLGATPEDAAAVETATHNADYTVTGLTWNETLTDSGKFKAGQAYTATVTLTSKNNKKFQTGAFTPTVTGAASVSTTTTTGSAIGNTVTFTVTYAATGALAVTGIAVTTQPTKMSYAEASDGTLALNGMVITETSNEGSTKTVTFTDGTATGYTTSPANGSTLTNAANNAKPVIITHATSGKTANTANLAVASISEIAAAAVTITAPVLGATPEDAAAVETATHNADYTVTGLTWNEALTAGGKFKAGQAYTATVTLTSKNFKKFQAVAFTPTVTGAASVVTTTTTGSAIGNTVTFTVIYAATGALAVTGIAVTNQPTKMSYAEASDGTLALNGMVITETNNDGSTNTVTFTSGTATGYTASPANGSALTNAANNAKPVIITHATSERTANTANLAVASISEIAAAAVTITAPVLGATPEDAAAVETATHNADYTVTGLTWNEALTAGGKFKAGQAYTATVTLTSKNFKKFQAVAFTPTVTGAASVSTTTTTGSAIGNTVTFTVTYAATGDLAVTGIAVTTQPTKMSYAEASDGTLALNGLMVTETNNDGSKNTVTFTSGTATGYTASPANGTALTNAANNAKPVIITHATSGKTANTANLAVASISEIAAAAVTITAPVLGATPEDAAAVETATQNADYTVTGLAWNEALTAGGKFKAGQAYTATVTLTSRNNKKFQTGAFTPTVTGAVSVSTTTTTGSAIGNTVTFTVTYAATGALAVTGIAVTSQPTKMSYAEASDGILALNGMVITETNNDGSTNTVTFTAGTATGYTTSPANGSALTNAANNGNPVVVTHAASAKTANTNNLSVSAIVEIAAAAVTITAPVLGATPEDAAAVETATQNADYTVTGLAWNEALTAGGKFKAGQAYTATVTLTSRNNKKFQTGAFTPTVTGAVSVSTTTTTGSAIGNTVTFTVTYAATGDLAVTGIAVTTQPTKMSYAEASDGTLALNGMVITETNNDGSTNTVTFTSGTATGYTASPANGSALTNAANNGNPVVVTHAASAKTANTNNLSVSAIVEIAAAAVTITAPVLGATPEDAAAVETATHNADYTVTGLTWNEALTVGGKFKSSQAYTATVTLTSKNNKKFQTVAFTPTVTGAASVSTTTTIGSAIGNTVTFTVTYAATNALALNSIAVTTQPTKLSYAEMADGLLTLNGMVVTETYNDGSTILVSFPSGTATGYTTSPANGSALTNAANNGNPVVVTHAASSKTANTNNLTVSVGEISAAAVTITAPVLGVKPQTFASIQTANSDPDFSVTAFAWNEGLTDGGKFKAGQVYTATITLTSKNFKRFQAAPFTPTVAGSESVGATTTTGNTIGNTVTFTVTYASTGALVVTGIMVTTQPTKLAYAESSDGILSLNGMEVRETYNDGSISNVTFPGGTASGYTTSPANGTALTNTANNGNPVTVTHTASAKNGYTSVLSVVRDFTSPNIGNLKLVPAGSFKIDTSSVSSVSTFRMSQTEITRSQYLSIIGSDPSYSFRSSGMNDPVQNVNWYNAIVFCNKLSMAEGLTPAYTISGSTNPTAWGTVPTSDNATWNAADCNWSANGYRLPTEAEWIWAAMGATQDSQPGAMSGGINVTGYNKAFAGYNGSNSINSYAWYGFNVSGSATAQRTDAVINGRLPNELGIYDMTGNVNEWCWNWYSSSFPGLSDYTGPTSGTTRTVCGGAWSQSAGIIFISNRFIGGPSGKNEGIGFRVVRR